MRNAVMEKLEREKLGRALKKAAGLWRKDEYPEFETVKDINKWVSELRKGTLRRSRQFV